MERDFVPSLIRPLGRIGRPLSGGIELRIRKRSMNGRGASSAIAGALRSRDMKLRKEAKVDLLRRVPLFSELHEGGVAPGGGDRGRGPHAAGESAHAGGQAGTRVLRPRRRSRRGEPAQQADRRARRGRLVRRDRAADERAADGDDHDHVTSAAPHRHRPRLQAGRGGDTVDRRQGARPRGPAARPRRLAVRCDSSDPVLGLAAETHCRGQAEA